MKNQTFSVHAAAVLLERDRGIVSRTMRGIKPDATDGGVSRWRLRTIVEALAARDRYSANPRATPGRVNLANERALLAREQKNMVAHKNAIARGEFAPVSVLVAVMKRHNLCIRENLLGIPGKLADDLSFGDVERRVIVEEKLRDEIYQILENLSDPESYRRFADIDVSGDSYSTAEEQDDAQRSEGDTGVDRGDSSRPGARSDG